MSLPLEGRRIAVAGGGLSGLTAALRLQQMGAAVTVFEADPELGGRARTDNLDGFGIDVGAQLVASMYRRFIELVREIGMGDDLIPAPGRDALWRRGRAHEVVYGSVASMIASGGLPLTTKMRMGAIYVPFLTRNTAALELLEPERAADAGLDSETISEWGEREIDGPFVRSLVYPQLAAYYGSRPDETSAGFYHILARYGMDVALSAVRGGIGRVAERLAERLPARGGEVRLSSPIRTVEPTDDGVRIAGDWGELRAHGIVSALPAPTAREVLRPILATETSEWISAVRYRPCLSVALLLDRAPAARYFGLSFPQGDTRYVAALCLQHNKPGVRVPDGAGLIVAMVTPETAPALIELGSREVIDRILPEIRDAIPDIEGRITRARVYRWPVGGPTFFPGYLGHLGRFRRGEVEGDGPMAFAGDYLYSPSVEGAVVSGAEAAKRLAARLRSTA